MARQEGEPRVLGPYYHGARGCWRIVVVLGKDDRQDHYFEKEAEAARAKRDFEREIADANRRTVWEAIEAYVAAALQDNKPRSREQTEWALKTFFADEQMLLT